MFQLVLMLLIQGPHLQNHGARQPFSSSAAQYLHQGWCPGRLLEMQSLSPTPTPTVDLQGWNPHACKMPRRFTCGQLHWSSCMQSHLSTMKNSW